jgi:hypothetical protein
MFTYPHCHYRCPAMPTYRIRTEPFLAETLRDESGASGDVHQLTGGTISVSAIDGVHTANIVILGQYSGTGFTTSVDNGGGTMVTYHDPHAIA